MAQIESTEAAPYRCTTHSYAFKRRAEETPSCHSGVTLPDPHHSNKSGTPQRLLCDACRGSTSCSHSARPPGPFRHQGWWVKDAGDSRRRTISDGKYVQVGETYVAMFVLHPDGPERVIIALGSSLVVDDGRIGVLGEDLMPLQVGMTTAELGAQMSKFEEAIGPLPEGPVLRTKPEGD